MLTIIIIFAIISISLFLFVSLFTYNIRLETIELVTKSQESLIPLAIVNSDYLDGDSLAISFERNQDETTKIIDDFIVKYKNYETSQLTQTKSVHYYYSINNVDNTIEYISNGKCLSTSKTCTKYTFRTKFPMPKIFDGQNFLGEFVFTSYV